ncbi:pilus assembly protein PilP [Halomonas sp. 18H]|uniref:pilus assembly protein PilP n=1 Tax=Halomonas almeriensis TaxID=308163 RepID=UPI0022323903|nr:MULTISPECIES: pilus assembly protein PilP [Halomonas]MCW4149694.1 pilus assembly protein PilP [Halomonas sp. 18H]MDN3553361.1 pilus assembly protein PilP [Halomonas almeriensis]
MKIWCMGCLSVAVTALLAGCDDAHLTELDQRLADWRVEASAASHQWVPAGIRPPPPAYRQGAAPSPFAARSVPASEPSGVAEQDAAPEGHVLPQAWRLLGTLQVGEQAWALLKGPAGKEHLVTAGDRVAGARIMTIEAAHLELAPRRTSPDDSVQGTVKLTLEN